MECRDCPKSLIDDESMQLVQILRQDRHAKEATGGTLFGQDRGKWPAVWDDAVQISERIRIMEHNEEIRASHPK